MSALQLWHYVAARENIRRARAHGEPWPWTQDAILRKYKFTNVRRIHDRTTQAFLKVYQANHEALPHVALYNCGVWRWFGTEDFMEAVGWQLDHDESWLRQAHDLCVSSGARPWTGAYTIAAGAAGVPKWKVVAERLGALWLAAKDVTDAIRSEASWAAGYAELRELPGFGGFGFMAKEVLQDWLLWNDWCDTSVDVLDEATWTPIGPGARRGLNRLALRPIAKQQSEQAFLAEITTLRTFINERWLATFKDETPLTAHDIQFCLCEFDKYERVRLGEGRPRSTYKPPEALPLAPAAASDDATSFDLE